MALPNAVWGEAPAGVLDQTLQVPAQLKLDASGNVTGLVGPNGFIMQFVDVGGESSGTTVEV